MGELNVSVAEAVKAAFSKNAFCRFKPCRRHQYFLINKGDADEKDNNNRKD